MKDERRRITFTGRVQGVGFRMTTLHLAQDLPLAGTVQNLPDGRVELLVQGTGPDIDALLARLDEHFKGLIRNVEMNIVPTISTSGQQDHKIRVVT